MSNPEVGQSIEANGITTNFHDQGSGPPVLLIHGSGPGVSAWANWRTTIPALAERFRVLAPDMVGFGFTQRPRDVVYSLDTWVSHALGFMDALGIEAASVVGNSYGGALALAMAARAPQRVTRLVLMGSAGVSFPLTPGLEAAWGYQPSAANMKALMGIFAYDQRLVTDELAALRHQASLRPGVQEAFAAMFPAPRQRWIEALTTPAERILALPQPTLIVHGREDRVIPLDNAYELLRLIPKAQLHVFGQCGHWTQIEHCARFNRLVGDFLAEPAATS